MQQDTATLIYDLNTTKGTVESYLKKIAQPFKTVQSQAWKIAPGSKSLKKTENCKGYFIDQWVHLHNSSIIYTKT